MAGETLSSGDDAPRRLPPRWLVVVAVVVAGVVAAAVLVARHADATRRDQSRLRALDDVRVSVAPDGGGTSEGGHLNMTLTVTNSGGHPVTVSAATLVMRGVSGSAVGLSQHVPAGSSIGISLPVLVDCAIIGTSTQGDLRLTLLSAADRRHVVTQRIIDPRTDPAMTSMTLLLQACHAEDAGAALSTQFTLTMVRGRNVVGRLTLGNDGRSPLKVLRITADNARVTAVVTPAPPLTIPARSSRVLELRLHLASCTGASFRDGFALDTDASNERGRGGGGFDDSSLDSTMQRLSRSICRHL